MIRDCLSEVCNPFNPSKLSTTPHKKKTGTKNLDRGEDSQVRMWDLRTRRCKVIFTGHSKAVTCLTALREDGSNLILSGSKVRETGLAGGGYSCLLSCCWAVYHFLAKQYSVASVSVLGAKRQRMDEYNGLGRRGHFWAL